MTEPVRLVGVDLGQQKDYTAISVTERILIPSGKFYKEPYFAGHHIGTRYRTAQDGTPEYHVRHLERPPLGTRYTKVVERVVELVKTLGGTENNPLVLAVDATGVGRPVVDMLNADMSEMLEKTEELYVDNCIITITGGDSVTKNPDGGLRVPKRDLISATLVLFQNEHLKIARDLELRETLVKELLNFRVKINISTAHDSYEAWREGDHDDLVLSVALACWAGERYLDRRMVA